jgi:hypothetical protein
MAIASAAILFIYGSWKMPMGTLLTPAAGLVPLLLGCGTLVLAIVAIVAPEPAPEGVLGPKAEDEDAPGESGKVPRPLLIMIVLGLIIFGLERAGFLLTIMSGSFILLRFVERRPFVQSFMISLALSSGLYYLFSKLLYVNLPGGWLEF